MSDGTERILASIEGIIKPTIKNNPEAVKQKLKPYQFPELTPIGMQNILTQWLEQGKVGDVAYALSVPFDPNNGPDYAAEFFAEWGSEGDSLLKARQNALDAQSAQGGVNDKADAETETITETLTDMLQEETYVAPVVVVMMVALIMWIIN